MNWIKFPRQQMILAFAIALGLVSFTSCFTRIQAQTSKQVVSTVRFDPPPLPAKADKGAPSGRRTGGASRGLCLPVVDKPQPLTALVPATKETLGNKQDDLPGLTTFESVWGLTAADSPTVWFYVPYSLTPNLPIEFVLQDEQGNYVYKTSFKVSQTQPGIVKFRIPSTAPLEIDKMYRWFFSINCVPDDDVNGWVQRVAPSPTLASQLQKATPRESIALYASNGYWYDALTTLAELRSANPSDATLKNDWDSLLHSVQLDAIAQEPIVQCCTVEK